MRCSISFIDAAGVPLVPDRFFKDRLHPTAVREAAGRVFVGPAGALHDAVQ
jgi:hypothetical protein